MTQLYDVAMYALALFKLTEVGQGLEEEREGVIVRNNRLSVHAGVNKERVVRDARVSKGSNESVANENMGSGKLGEEGESGVQ